MKVTKTLLQKSIFILFTTVFSLVSCNTNDEDSIDQTNVENASEINLTASSSSEMTATQTVDIWLYTNNRIAISNEFFGVNNNWRTITNSDYSTFENKLESINYQGIRFPGGWESEYYDWNTDTTPNWSNAPAVPGASISTVLGTNPPSLSIVVPTVDAMNLSQWSTQWWAAIQTLKTKAVDAINAAGANNILSVEVGNEWWLQWAGGVSRSNKLNKYSHIAKRVVKHIRQTFPSANFKILVNGDFTEPSEFTTMNTIFGNDLSFADGVALHPYAGYNSTTHNIANVQSDIIACRDNFGKNYVHLSEWAPSKAYNNNKVYAQGANVLVELTHELARSGADAAAFWPPKNTSIPGLGLFSSNYNVTYPTAQIFGDMSQNYTGDALATTTNGAIKAVASRNGNRITVYVAGMDEPNTTVRLRVVGASPQTSPVSSHIFLPGNTSNTAAATPMTLTTNPSTYNNSFTGYEFNVNAQSQYSIHRLIFDVN
ncbi:hypothetical protein [Hyunsoonleella pacifica]|uniref:Uncharacterized protein n=1 Tax=Hyunsoonleella pacifica TaxID=1080224 RepID=A0A4Q9FRV4_9FLAO|nr:hypothetical protein [Hyunsoonleella pacifica]TBN18673.1 hypothetical protein EYD46_00985 [Hyunsoonleella pacifica]GGD03720.1 hypothetical protein GCM10011368_01960 [Hyunsoonleella pacifica]